MRIDYSAALAAVFMVGLAGCGASAERPAGEPATGNGAREPIAADVAQQDDLPPCPGINPDIRRPAGSNCLGILPEACGADRLTAFVGLFADPATRREAEALVETTDIRWIRPGDAVIEDLRANRLNFELDENDRIEKIDCY